MPRRPAPHRVAVETYAEDVHAAIEVTLHSLDRDKLAEHYTLAEIQQRRVAMAGVLARMALDLTPDVIRSRAAHGCGQGGGCGIRGVDITQLDYDVEIGPIVSITVPATERRQYLERIRQVLADVKASDLACVPSADDEDWWANPGGLLLRAVR